MMLEEWHDELRMDLHPTTITDDYFYCVPTTMLPDQCVLVSAFVDKDDIISSDMLGDEPKSRESCRVSLCSTTTDESYSLD
eukprot:1347496-Pyramimonas_sp.AAC.1